MTYMINSKEVMIFQAIMINVTKITKAVDQYQIQKYMNLFKKV